MEPWKRTILTIVLLLLGLTSTSVHADITETPSSGVFLEGSDVTLTCVVEGNNYVIWEDFREATEIFVGKEKNTEKKKYDNFEISSGDEDFSLIIKDVQLSDEGTYICKDRDQHPNATVTIGVLPNVYISVKQSEDTQAPQKSTEVNITCSAYNARPAVSVFELSVIGSEKTVNITNDKSIQNEDGKTYNASASVPYIVSSEDMSVYCRVFTAGRSLSHTENFYIPRCNIKISGNEIRCLCQGNPPVNTYYVDVNGHKHDGDVLLIEEDELMNIRCLATNELGTGQSNLLFPDDMHRKGFGIVPIAVIMPVLVLLVVLTVIYIRRRPGPSEKKPDEEQPKLHDSNEEEDPLISETKTKTDEIEKQEDAEVLLDKNEEDAKKEIHGCEHQPSNNINDANGEMSERKSTNDAEASSSSPKPESSLPRIDLTGDLKDPQTFIRKILSEVNLDWDIFAIKVLNISEKVVEEAVMENDNFTNQINAVTENMTSRHIKVLDENAEFCQKFGLKIVEHKDECFLQHTNNKQADLVPKNTSHTQDHTDISNSPGSDDILVSCGSRIGKRGIKKLLEAFGEKDIETEDGATILKMLEQKNVIRKPYVNLLRQLTKCNIYGARKILLLNFETDLQQLKTIIRNHVKNDWEIFAIEILDIPEKLVEDAVINNDTNVDQIEVVIREITAEHIGMMDDIKTHNKLEKRNLLSEFNLQSVEEEGRYYFKNMESTQSEKSSNEEIYQQDPPTIDSRDDMLKLCRDRIGKVGIRRLLAAFKKGDIETGDGTNVLKKLDENEVINKDCANLLPKLSDCNLFRARKIVVAYLEADLWKYITNNLCPQISVDWDIFAVDVLGLETHYVVDIIDDTKDEKGQVLSMFRKWRYMQGQQKKASQQFLQNLIEANGLSDKIMSKENILKYVTAVKVKPTNEGDNSKEFVAMLTTCSKRIGNTGSEQLADINSKYGIPIIDYVRVSMGVAVTTRAPEGISVNDSLNSLGQLCFMLGKANLFTARDVVITYIEKELEKVVATITKERASDWDKLALYGLSLSKKDVLYLDRAAMSNEERVRMAISKWMRKTDIGKDVQQTLMKKAAITVPVMGI